MLEYCTLVREELTQQFVENLQPFRRLHELATDLDDNAAAMLIASWQWQDMLPRYQIFSHQMHSEQV